MPPVTASPDTLTLSRRLSRAQAERRGAVVAAARALAAAGGYAAVTMQAVAARSGVARATLYRYFASKDHLLAEVVVAWGADLAAELRARHIDAVEPAERVAEVLVSVLDAARREPQLTAAALAATTSPDPEAVRAGLRFSSLIRSYLDVALGDDASTERDELAALLGHVFFSSVLLMTSGRLAFDEAAAAVSNAARRLFPRGASR